MPSCQYRKPHCGDKTILRQSYIHNWISYTGRMTSLYWIRAQVISIHHNDLLLVEFQFQKKKCWNSNANTCRCQRTTFPVNIQYKCHLDIYLVVSFNHNTNNPKCLAIFHVALLKWRYAKVHLLTKAVLVLPPLRGQTGSRTWPGRIN